MPDQFLCALGVGERAGGTAGYHTPSLLLAVLLCCTAVTQAQDSGSPTPRERVRVRLENLRQTSGDAAVSGAGSTQFGPGTHTISIAHGGLNRKVLVHIPPGYDAAKPMPLVMAFHGGGGHSEYMADDERYGLGRKADLEGFVVAYPNLKLLRRQPEFPCPINHLRWNSGLGF